MASQCWIAGRIEEAVRYSDAGQTVIGSGRDEVPYGIEGWLGGAVPGHRSARTVRSSGAAPSSHAAATPTHSSRANLVFALAFAGCR